MRSVRARSGNRQRSGQTAEKIRHNELTSIRFHRAFDQNRESSGLQGFRRGVGDGEIRSVVDGYLPMLGDVVEFDVVVSMWKRRRTAVLSDGCRFRNNLASPDSPTTLVA